MLLLNLTTVVPVRKPADIADGDRPYSAPETVATTPMEQISESEKLTTKRQQTDNKPETKLATNRQQSGNQTDNAIDNKVASQLTTELATSPSSSSLNINKTTTTELSDEWNFDITPYARFGFTSSQLKQIASLGVVSATDVEQSLIEFSYDLGNNTLPQIKTTKINFLMGLLRSGHTYVSEGFKNEQEAMISEMARRVEGKRKKLLEEKFVSWESSLSSEDRKKILAKLPTSLMVLEKTYGINSQEVRSWYFDYFMQNVRG